MTPTRISLRWKLVAAFALVVAFGVLTTGLMARQRMVVEFFEFMGRSHGMTGMGRHMSDMWQMMNPREEAFVLNLDTVMIQAGLLGLALSLAVSFLIARRILRPVEQIRRTALAMAGGDFARRITLQGNDELGDLAEAINNLAENLERAEILRKNLVADVAHELRTPLTTMRSYMEALRDGVIPPDERNLSAILEETLRLSRLVNDLQDLSLLEADRLTLNIRPVALDRILDQILATREADFRDKGLALDRSLPSAVSLVRGDPDRLSQVLHNLLANAIQYTPAGGRVQVAMEVRKPFLVTSIVNTGVRLVAEDVDRIFERFFRVEKSRSRKGGGVGLGLTIARKLVEAQGGEISIHSGDEGVVVAFTVPLAD